MENRRKFIRNLAVVSAGLAVGNKSFGFSASSYRKIIGANDRIHAAIIGLNGRGSSMADTFAKQTNLEIISVCDVDSRTIPKVIKIITDAGQATPPKGKSDCRKLLQDKQLDAIYIATPPSSHEEYAIAAINAGKPV